MKNDLISRKAAIEALEFERDLLETPERITGVEDAIEVIQHLTFVPAVPLEPLCKLLAEMYHCPASGRPSSGRACHPNCTDEMLETICGLACDDYSDEERWKTFLINWMKKDEG